MTGETTYTQNLASAFVQSEPGKQPLYIGDCLNIDSLTNQRYGGKELRQCRNRIIGKSPKWNVIGTRYTPPGPQDFSLQQLTSNVISAIARKMNCPFILYGTLRSCGDLGLLEGWERAAAVTGVDVMNDALTPFAHQEEEADIMNDYSCSANPGRIDSYQLTEGRKTTSEARRATAVTQGSLVSCGNACGAPIDQCDVFYTAHESTVAAANVLKSTDGGDTWAALAAQPFAIGESLTDIIAFQIGKTTERIMVARDADGANPAEVGYSDDNGATWTLIEVGVTNGEYVTKFALIDRSNIWVTTSGGRVFKSTDGGITWTHQASALTASSANPLNDISFISKSIGYAVGDSDTIIRTLDGGNTWAARTATGSGDDLLSVQAFTEWRLLVGSDATGGQGSLWISFDGAATYETRIFEGYTTETVDSISFANELQGYIVTNTAAPVGSIHRTIDGGYTWEEIPVEDNDGFSDVVACDGNTIVFVGEETTAFIGKANARIE